MAALGDHVSMAQSILGIIEEYRLREHPFDQEIVTAAAEFFLPKITAMIQAEQPITMVLPAFPFKSPNKVDKVLGVLPDKAEEVALTRLQGLCESVKEIYSPGASLVIVSDGLVYNDLLGVTDADVWNYGATLRIMAADARLDSIRFVRLTELLGTSYLKDNSPPRTAEEYEISAPFIRNELLRTCSDEDYTVERHISSDENALATYKGYIKFLSKDLATVQNTCGWESASSATSGSPSEASSVEGIKTPSRKSLKRQRQRIAKQMIGRGKCFANLVRRAYPDAIRLSIHASRTPSKISIVTLPESSIPMTPWHCAVVCRLDGSIVPSTRAQITEAKELLEPVQKDGRLWCYRERSPLYAALGADVHIEHIYPCGLRIEAMHNHTPFEVVDMQKIRQLAEHNSPVILRRFANTKNQEVFVTKCHEMGEIQKWKFGELLKVRDASGEDGGLNNVLSAEPMPMHFDGMFKIVDGKPNPPNFQIFTAVTASPPGIGRTLFASSLRFFDHLPQPYSLGSLSSLTYSVETPAFNNAKLTHLTLVSSHPTLGTPVLRYHEHWPRERTAFDPTLVEIEGVDSREAGRIQEAIEHTLYDRRVCVRLSWEAGDICVSDNVGMMHTREGFPRGLERELWRIHVN